LGEPRRNIFEINVASCPHSRCAQLIEMTQSNACSSRDCRPRSGRDAAASSVEESRESRIGGLLKRH
jgi:hypothetical protein